MASLINMHYGSFDFEPNPIPFMTINKEYIKNAAGINVGTLINVTLEGTIVEATGGVIGGLTMVDFKMDVIREAFNQDGLLFKVTCDGPPEVIYFSGYPRVNSIQFDRSTDNWVMTAPYTIELEFDDAEPDEDDALMPPYLQDVNETWNMDFVDERYPFIWQLPDSVFDSCPLQFRISHEISAQGKSHYDVGGLVKPAWEYAKDYVVSKLGFNFEFLTHTGVIDLNPANFDAFNHLRNIITDVAAGRYTVNESWLVVQTGSQGSAGAAIEDYSVNVRAGTDNPFTNVVVEGEIRGLTQLDMTDAIDGFDVDVSAYTHASGYWQAVKPKLVQRVQMLGDSTAVRPFNVIPLNTSVGHDPCRGVINYTYEYNDRPPVCIQGALQENVTITDNNPADVFAVLTVLGRAAGPVLQSIGTVTAPTRRLSVDIIMQPATGCPESGGPVSFGSWYEQKPVGVQQLVTALEADLESNYNQVFKTEDVETWEATLGRFTRNVNWTFGSC
jgi:hypothetical protein